MGGGLDLAWFDLAWLFVLGFFDPILVWFDGIEYGFLDGEWVSE